MTNRISIKEQPWYHDPFGWYNTAENVPKYGVELNETVALDFMIGLSDMYKSLERNDFKQGMHDARVLAVLLIAAAYDYGDEAIEELLAEEFDNLDLDKEVEKLVKEENDK